MTHPLIKFVESVCVQTMVYWSTPTPDGYGGFTYSTPEEISCRWDEKMQLVRGANGEEVVSKAEVMVTRDIDEGGFLYLGSLDDLSVAQKADPMLVDGAWKVLSISKTPLFQSTDEFVRTVYL
jgi:hypothetical protein